VADILDKFIGVYQAIKAPTPGEPEDLSDKSVIKGVNATLGICFTISMSLDLKNNWDNYADVGKAFNVLQIAIQGLAALVDASLLVGDALVASRGLAADCPMMIVLPVLGAVLAVVGIVVPALLTFLHHTKPSVPEDTPVEKLLKDTAHPFIDRLTPQPKPKLTYSAPAQVTADASSAQVPITGTNHTGVAGELAETVVMGISRRKTEATT